MKTKDKQIDPAAQQGDKTEGGDLPGYQSSLPADDIFSKYIEKTIIHPDDTTKSKFSNEKVGKNIEKDFRGTTSGGDLGVPGSQLDDE